MSQSLIETPMAAAVRPTTDNRTGDWRFERPVFIRGMAPCMEACPLGVDVASALLQVEEGDLKGALETFLAENPLPGACGVACFHPCESACNRGKFDAPVSVRDLELFLARENNSGDFPSCSPSEVKDAPVAVLGSGPSVLSAAAFLARMGYRVSLYRDGRRLEDYLPEKSLEADASLSLVREEEGRILSSCESLGELKDFTRDEAERYGAVYLSPDLDISKVEGAWSDGALARALEEAGRMPGHYGLVVAGGRVIPVEARVGRKGGSPEKGLPRDAAGGKRAALLVDMALTGTDPLEMNSYEVGRTGILLFSSHGLGEKGDRFQKVIQFNRLNTSSFEEAARIPSPGPGAVFSREEAVASARRCFHCGLCTFCFKCYDFCPDLSIIMDGKSRYRAIDLDHCKGCGICFEECPRGAVDWVKEDKGA